MAQRRLMVINWKSNRRVFIDRAFKFIDPAFKIYLNIDSTFKFYQITDPTVNFSLDTTLCRISIENPLQCCIKNSEKKKQYI